MSFSFGNHEEERHDDDAQRKQDAAQYEGHWRAQIGQEHGLPEGAVEHRKDQDEQPHGECF